MEKKKEINFAIFTSLTDIDHYLLAGLTGIQKDLSKPQFHSMKQCNKTKLNTMDACCTALHILSVYMLAKLQLYWGQMKEVTKGYVSLVDHALAEGEVRVRQVGQSLEQDL